MIQKPPPDNCAIASGEMHSVRDLSEVAFGLPGLDCERYVHIDAKYLRTTEVDELRGGTSKLADAGPVPAEHLSVPCSP